MGFRNGIGTLIISSSDNLGNGMDTWTTWASTLTDLHKLSGSLWEDAGLCYSSTQVLQNDLKPLQVGYHANLNALRRRKGNMVQLVQYPTTIFEGFVATR